MGTSKGYSPTSKFGAGSSNYLSPSYGSSSKNYSSSNYQPSNRYSYGGSSPYSSSNKFSSYGGGSSGLYSPVKDRIQRFSTGENRSSRQDMYSPLSSNRAPSVGRDLSYGYDKHSARSASSDPYANRSGYLSDYGGSTRSFGSYDNSSLRSGRSYGGASRESSPVSNRSSRYEYSGSASPSYSTYTSEASPPVSRKYERQQARPSETEYDPYERRRSRDYGIPPPPRKEMISSESDTDDSAPEAEKDGVKGRYLISRGTSPIPEGGTRREIKQYKRGKSNSIAKTKRIRPLSRELRRDGRYRGRPSTNVVDCSTQTLEPPSPRRSRRGSMGSNAGSGGVDMREKAALAALAMMEDGGGGTGAGEAFYKYRDKFSNPMPPGYSDDGNKSKRYGYRDSEPAVADVPGEKSWRKAVYGDVETPKSSVADSEDEGPVRRRRRAPRTSTPKSPNEIDMEDTRSSRYRQKDIDRDPRPDYHRSSSRDSILDETPRRKRHSSRELLDDPVEPAIIVHSPVDPQPPVQRRRRHGSRELLDDPVDADAPLTPENLSLRDSIEKVQQWKQQLPLQDPFSGEVNPVPSGPVRKLEAGFPRSDSGEYFSAHDYPPSKSSKHSERDLSSRDVSPDRMRGRRSMREPSPTRDESPPSRRGRRGRLRSDRDDNVFANDSGQDYRIPNKSYRKSNLNRSLDLDDDADGDSNLRAARSDSRGLNPPAQGNRKSGSSSDAFSRDDSPNRRHSRQSSYESRRIRREGSREDALDDRKQRRDGHQSDRGQHSDSSHYGFNREDSPNRFQFVNRRQKSRHNSREDNLDDRKPYSRQGSHDDVLDDRGTAYNRPKSLGVSNESLAHMSNSSSIPSMNSVVPDDGNLRKTTSTSSVMSNETRATPSPRSPNNSGMQKGMKNDSGLPDLVSGSNEANSQQSSRKPPQQAKRTKSGFIGTNMDIDNLLNSDDEDSKLGKNVYKADGKNVRKSQNLMDAPVPDHPHPIQPKSSGNFTSYARSDDVDKILLWILCVI